MDVKNENVKSINTEVPQTAEGIQVVQPSEGGAQYRRKISENFGFFGGATLLYAILYALCMFKNASGVSFPFFVAGSLWYMYSCLSKLEISLKKSSYFPVVCMLLLAIATFTTDDSRIIFFNKTGIFLLVLSTILNQFYDTERWKLGKYLGSIVTLLANSLCELPAPVRDFTAYFKAKQGKYDKKVLYGILGGVIMLPMLAVILGLLGSADIVFRQELTKLLELIELNNIFNILLRIVVCFFGVYGILCYICGLHIKEEVADRRKGEPMLMLVLTVGLTVVYCYFSVIQIVYLFMGRLQLPEGYTYAEYAREGFFQLLAVGIINLVIVLVSLAYFKENKALKIVLTLMSLCTFVMIASSAYRMIINIRYYYLTFMRILVLWALVVLFMVFCGVVVSIWREQFHLFRYGMTLVSVLYIALSFSHPDYWIARVNLSNTVGQEKSAFAQEFFLAREGASGSDYRDFYYLGHLSADAAPVIFAYMDEIGYAFTEDEQERAEAAANLSVPAAEKEKSTYGHQYSQTIAGFGYRYLDRMKECTEEMSWRSFNISRYIAGVTMEKYQSN